MKAEIEQLVALQNADTNIRRLQAEIEAIPRRRAEIEKEFDQRAFEIRELERTRDEARLERARLENEVLEHRSKQERAERNQMLSKKQDEYQAAIREADAARKHISQLETQILEKMETIEQTRAVMGQLHESTAAQRFSIVPHGPLAEVSDTQGAPPAAQGSPLDDGVVP